MPDITPEVRHSQDLAPPKPSSSQPANVAIMIWSLLLPLSSLALFTASPRRAPPFESLTEFTCNRVPVFTGTRLASTLIHTTFTCRSGDKVIYQQGLPSSVGAYKQLKACLIAGGTLTLWRQPIPTPYGRIVFQTACGGTIYADYKTQAANYDSTQLFVRILAWAVVALGVWRLSLRAWHHAARS